MNIFCFSFSDDLNLPPPLDYVLISHPDGSPVDQDSYRESSKSLPSLKLKLVVKEKFAETMARQKLWSESDVDRTEGTKGVDSSRDKLWKSFDDSCENDTIPVMEVSSNPADVSGSESDDKRPVRKRRSSFADSFYQVWPLTQFFQLALVKNN